MKRISTISLCLVLLAALSGHAWAGTYKCVYPGGSGDSGAVPPDGLSYIVPVVFHYNTGNSPQNITRLKLYDQFGVLQYDSGPIPAGGLVVPGHGSTFFFDVETGGFQGYEWIVTFSGGGALGRLNLLNFDQASNEVLSTDQSPCQ